jgi:type VI secretion system secreted protein VgrG
MPSYSQDRRYMTFEAPASGHDLLAESFRGSEGISELFDFQIELLADKGTVVNAKDLVGKRATLTIEATENGDKRYFNGIVASFEFCGGDSFFEVYRAYVVPAFWLATLNTNTRVFQDLTVTDIVKNVLAKYNINLSIETSETYQKLEYCTQYRETDFSFVSRLMEQHGIYYFFSHTENDHQMILADRSGQQKECSIQHEFKYAPEFGHFDARYDFVINNFSSKSSLVTGKHNLWDYRYQLYKTVNSGGAATDSRTRGPLGDNSHEEYDYADGPSAYVKKIDSDGNIPPMQDQFRTIRRDISDSDGVVVCGSSNISVLLSGYTFELTKYPQDDLNTKYLLTRVTHTASQNPPYRTHTSEAPLLYRNEFTAIPSSLTYRTPRKTLKPRVSGVVTGKVVVPSGADSYMDKYGRVCVQFLWDRLREEHKPDNTLLRVAQSWAGSGWGTYFWPRVDDEVLIDFIEGDPDAPIVVGSVYNGVNMPKYDPAQQYTRAGILTRSSKQGGAANANELRFEDLKGSEQIFINAERDFDTHVEHDEHALVGNEQHLSVVANQYHQIGGDAHLKVGKNQVQDVEGDVHLKIKGKELEEISGDKQEKVSGNHMEDIGQNAHLKVGENLNEKVGMNYSLKVGMNQYNKVGMVYVVDSGQEVHIKGGMNVVIEGGLGVCLSGPGGFVSIDPSGVTIQGMLVKINSGGASLQGSPANPEDPQAPDPPKDPTAPSWPGDDPRAKK